MAINDVHMVLRWCSLNMWNARYRVGFGRTASKLVLVHVWIWMRHYLVYDASSQLHARLLFLLNYNGNGVRLYAGVDVDWIYGTLLCWLWTNSEYVGTGACLNLNAPLLASCNDAPCVTQSQLHTRLLFKHTTTATAHETRLYACWFWCWLNILYETVSCWFWTNRMYVGIGACLNPNVFFLVHDAPWHDHNCILVWYSNTLQRQWHMTHDSELMLFIGYMQRSHIDVGRSPAIPTKLQSLWRAAVCWCWCCLNIWDGIVLAFNEQQVCWYWCMFEFECVIAWYTMHHDTIAIAHPPAIQLQWEWHTAMTLMLIEYMERCRVGFGRTGSTLVLLNVWIWMWHCLVYDALLHHRNWTLACYYSTTMAMTCGSALMLMFIKYMERYRVGFGRTGCMLVLVHVWIWMCHCLVYDVPWHHCYSTVTKMTYGSALVLMLIEYMDMYHVGFGLTGCTLVLVHVWVWICHYLVYDAPWHDHNCTLGCYLNTLQRDGTWYTTLRWCWLNTWNGIVLALDGWSDSTLVLVNVWIWRCYYLVAIHPPWHDHNCKFACYSNTLQRRRQTILG